MLSWGAGRLRSQKGACLAGTSAGTGRIKSPGTRAAAVVTTSSHMHVALASRRIRVMQSRSVRVDVRSYPGLLGQRTAYYTEVPLPFVFHFRIIAFLNLSQIVVVIAECMFLDVHVAAVFHGRSINQSQMSKIIAVKD